MNLTNLFLYLVSLSLLGSILALGIILVKQLFKHKLSAWWHYYIWFALVLRLIIPYMPPSTFSLFNLLSQYSSTFSISKNVSQSPANIVSITSNIDSVTVLKAGNELAESPLISPKPDRNLGLNWKTAAFLWLIGVLVILFYIIAVNSYMLF